MRNLSIYFLLIFTLLSCKENVINGIEIGQDLYVGQSLEQNRKLSELITRMLNKESDAFTELTEFWCGGGAGCYDLGYVLTQIIYRIGEDDFAKILREIPKSKQNEIEGLIAVGLEYGDNDFDGKMDDKRMETEFPKLTEILNK
ncbi:hypothetical protein [Xanthomarina spongicola]|uniref:Uncharacterized protein n=1 Tax=Xanthomarina spongicola TaxID=570520 RepID=A0A316E1K4_9FLAO|nr:hypothetical protein [Xanthomarina spongicola]PWK16690.1 hypothetical protein LX78_02957 [Xanthomarina spongicola]